MIKLSKKTQVNRITESIESGYFTSIWKSACTALTIATAAATALAAELPTSLTAMPSTLGSTSVAHLTITVALPFLGDTPMPSMSTQFTLDSIICAVLSEEFKPSIQCPLEAVFAATPESLFPVSDTVFNMVQKSHVLLGLTPEPLATPISKQPCLPDLYNAHSALGIKKPSHAEEIITPKGIYIYAPNRTFARRLQALIAHYPDLWIDRGTINMPTEMQLKIPLVDGWQNHKLNSCGYPLSYRDCEFLD